MPRDLMNAVESFSPMAASVSRSSVQAKQSKTSVRIRQGKEILKSLNLSILKSFNPSRLLQFPLRKPAFVEGDAQMYHEVVLLDLAADAGRAFHPFHGNIDK